MNHRILIAAVAALSIAGVSVANAEPDSSGAGGATIGYTDGYYMDGYRTGTDYSSNGYMSYGSANTRVRVQDQDSYAGPRTSYQYRSVQPRGQMCLDEENRFDCR